MLAWKIDVKIVYDNDDCTNYAVQYSHCVKFTPMH